MHRDSVNEHGIAIFGHREISDLAYSLWQGRGCPEGSAEEDWFHAAHQLRARPSSASGSQQNLKGSENEILLFIVLPHAGHCLRRTAFCG
jgi:hypothetical protein